jgi:two-component system chemotaxis response regulator CheY
MHVNGHRRILIIDDEENIRLLLKHIFETWKPDYQVVTAPDGFTAMARLMQRGFDLVLTDWQMAEMDGLELAEAILDISPDTKILLMTGAVTSELDSAVKSLGLAGWIEKPFTPTHILNVVEQLIT